MEGANEDGWLRIDSANDLVDLNLMVDFPIDGLLDVASVDISLNGQMIEVSLDTDLANSDDMDRITAYAIEVRPSDNNEISTSCWESECANVVGEDQFGMITESFDGFEYGYPFYVKIKASFCFTPDAQ